MKIQIEKKYLIWVLLFSCILIIGSQFIVSYEYKDLNNHIAEFINSEIKNERIIRIADLPYTPGKGTYKEIYLELNKNFPLLIEDQEEKIHSISLDQRISKQSKSKEFFIENNNKLNKYEIRTLKSEERFTRIYLLSIAIFVSIAALFKYNIKLSQSN